MNRYLLIILSLFSLLSGKEENIDQMEIALSAECEPLVTVADCVNVLSGHFFQADHDLVTNTIDPLYMERTYDSGGSVETFMGFAFGSQFPLTASETQKGSRHSYAMISERDGFLIPYQGKSKHSAHRIDPRLFEKGYTNAGSGHSHLVNWKATLGTCWKVKLGNGCTRTYGLITHHGDGMGVPTKKVYLLTEETKPNGNTLRFHYTSQEKPRLSKIQTLNRVGQPINELCFEYKPHECHVTSPCGSYVMYATKPEAFKHSVVRLTRNMLYGVYRSQKADLCYNYVPNVKYLDHFWVTKVENPNGRFLEVTYNKDKVASLQEPVGREGETVTTYRFQYEKNFTQVFDAHNQLTEYHFDKKQRLSAIRTIDRQDLFEWSPNGLLQKKSIYQGDHCVLSTAYYYDLKGNITRKVLSDNSTTEYSYSADDFNLLLSKTTPTGLLITYAYLPGTHLCTKEFHHYQGKIQERIFRFYDDNGQLQGLLEDDGSGQEHTDQSDVTYVKEKFIYSVTTPTPSFGKPLQIYEKHLDHATGRMIEQNRTDYFYNDRGSEISQEIYDAAGNFCYKTYTNYDVRLNITFKTDPLGVATNYTYHDNNKIAEKNENGKNTYYTYDKANRLICKEEKHPNGDIFTTKYSYNALNQLTSEIDPYGHETAYEYDRLGNLTKTTYPAIDLAVGVLHRPTVVKTYNVLGQVISQTDENGHTTQYSYTIRGDPTQIVHPDGSFTRYDYHPSGFLKQKWDTDGSSISYTQDAKGRILTKTFWDETGAFLKQEEHRYKGALLVYKKDASGLETFYHYDGAGRKIEEKTLNQVIQTTYDSFNRPIKISQEDQHELLEYDWKDRVTSRTLQDTSGKVYAKTTYAYDIDGNLIQKTIHNAVYQANYQRDGSLLSTKDPLGHEKSWEYNHKHQNGWGQQVQCRNIIDQLGRETREADNPHHLLARKDIYDNNQPVSITHYHYDPAGHLIQQSTREYIVQWSYNNRGQLASETAQGITTHYHYDPKNRLVQKTKADGVTLHYTYDALDRITKLHSSDGTISYCYLYDLNNNPTEIHDLVHHNIQKRRYDPFNRLIEEELSPGVTLRYHYDTLGRLTQLTLPDTSTILYEYDPFHLRTAKRPSYTILCQEYDQAGRLLKIETPAGPISYTYDLLGRAISIKSAAWESHHTHFDPVGNLLNSTQKDPQGEHLEQFAYDRFNYLTQETSHQYRYDGLGNCIEKNQIPQEVNSLNQITHDGQSSYNYDQNGNLIAIADHTAYHYDALNRLIRIEKEGEITTLLYDSFNRCLKITNPQETKHLLYQHAQEIGSFQNGQLQEFRLIHPEKELTFAIEQKGSTFFPVQDQQNNICALYTADGALSQWTRITPFGSKITFGNVNLPWSFANRREICGLSLFTDRLYNPDIMRWLTTDPIRFKDSLNLYTYNHNNPFRFTDPHGRYAYVVYLFTWAFGESLAATLAAAASAVTAITLTEAATAIGCLAVVTMVKNHIDSFENKYNQMLEEEEEKKAKEKESGKKEWVFPENPDDLLPEIPRDKKGRIQASDNIRIRPEKHEMEEGETHNPRHHDQHYHVETRRDPDKGWGKKNVTKLKPLDYDPGSGTGFLVGETFPGA